MKCTKIYNARAQPLFCSLNLLFSDVPVAVAVVVYFLNSLMARERKLVQRLVNDLFLSRLSKLITIPDRHLVSVVLYACLGETTIP